MSKEGVFDLLRCRVWHRAVVFKLILATHSFYLQNIVAHIPHIWLSAHSFFRKCQHQHRVWQQHYSPCTEQSKTTAIIKIQVYTLCKTLCTPEDTRTPLWNPWEKNWLASIYSFSLNMHKWTYNEIEGQLKAHRKEYFSLKQTIVPKNKLLIGIIEAKI